MSNEWKQQTIYGILLVCVLGLVFQVVGCKSFGHKKDNSPATVEEMLSQPRPGDHLRMGK